MLVFFRCLYLFAAALLMLTGLIGLTDVREVTGTLLGGGPADLVSAYATGFALALLWAGMLFRMRGAQWLMGFLLLFGGLLSGYALATYPSEASDPSISAVFSPGSVQLYSTVVVFTGLLLIVTLRSASAWHAGATRCAGWCRQRSRLSMATFAARCPFPAPTPT